MRTIIDQKNDLRNEINSLQRQVDNWYYQIDKAESKIIELKDILNEWENEGSNNG